MSDHKNDGTEDRDELNPLEKLRETFREEVEELIELGLDVEDLAERKAGLLKAYIDDDIHGAKEFWLDLKAEANSYEEFIFEWLLKAANPTALDWLRIKQYSEVDEDQYLSGEKVKDTELICASCGETSVIEGEVELSPCSNCGCELFRVRSH